MSNKNSQIILEDNRNDFSFKKNKLSGDGSTEKMLLFSPPKTENKQVYQPKFAPMSIKHKEF